MNLNYFELLPDEMLLKILLETDDLETLSKWCQTSKRVNQICKDKGFWHNKYRKDFGELTLAEGETWREQYKQTTQGRINSPISAGDDHYGIIDQNGNLYMAGNNERGQLGVGNDILESKIPILVKFPGKTQKVISISTGYRVSGAVTEDGKVYIWGYDEYGTYFSDPDWIRLPKELIGPGKAVKIEIDSHGYIVLLEDFSIYFSLYLFDNEEYIKGHIQTNVIDISIGIDSDVLSIITKDHKLYMWGKLKSFDKNRKNYVKEPVHIFLPEPVVKVSLGARHIMALSTTGNVYTLGLNVRGALGINNEEGVNASALVGLPGKIIQVKIDESVLVELPEKIIQIDAGNDTSAALSKTGKLYMWGSNFGNKITSDYYPKESSWKPKEISFGFLVNFISVGWSFTIAVSNDQIVNYWGV